MTFALRQPRHYMVEILLIRQNTKQSINQSMRTTNHSRRSLYCPIRAKISAKPPREDFFTKTILLFAFYWDQLIFCLISIIWHDFEWCSMVYIVRSRLEMTVQNFCHLICLNGHVHLRVDLINAKRTNYN